MIFAPAFLLAIISTASAGARPTDFKQNQSGTGMKAQG
jgi:hypothetical protein